MLPNDPSVTLGLCPCGSPGVMFSPGRAAITGPGGILVQRGEASRATCLSCYTSKRIIPKMVERVRGAQGDNVTDELRIQALGDIKQHDSDIMELSEELKTLKSERSNRIKHYKGLGMRTEALKKVSKERFKDAADVLADLHEETRLRALSNMPTIQMDLAALLGNPLDITDDQKAEIARQRWRDDGAFAGREGAARDSNMHPAGSEAYQQWDTGWLNSQERIARAMKDGDAPAVDTSRSKPDRKMAAGTAADKPAPKKAAAKKGAPRKTAAPTKDETDEEVTGSVH